jgi:hypothetical protein
VELIPWSGPPQAVRKTRLTPSDFELEMNIHLALEKCSTVFPRVIRADLHSKTIYLEYCSMGNLKTVMERLREPWPPKRVYNVMVQLLIGLSCFHRLSYVHGDIQAYHILLAEAYAVKLSGLRKTRPVEGEICTHPAFKEDIYRLGEVFASLLLRTTPPYDPSQLAIKYKYFPAPFKTALTSMLIRSPNSMTARDLLLTLTNLDQINTSHILKIEEFSDSGEWIGEETKQALMELQLEQSFSQEIAQIEEKSTDSAKSRSFAMQEDQGILQKRLIRMGAMSESIPREIKAIPFDGGKIAPLIEEAIELHKTLKGCFRVTLKEPPVNCSPACGSTLVKSQGVELPCRHSFCPACLNKFLRSAIEQRLPYRLISCPLCQKLFDPLNTDIVAAYLSAELISELTEMQVSETVKSCPKCGYRFDPDWTGQPRTIKCSWCKKKLCNYCLQQTHAFGCSKFRKDSKSLTSK